MDPSRCRNPAVQEVGLIFQSLAADKGVLWSEFRHSQVAKATFRAARHGGDCVCNEMTICSGSFCSAKPGAESAEDHGSAKPKHGHRWHRPAEGEGRTCRSAEGSIRTARTADQDAGRFLPFCHCLCTLDSVEQSFGVSENWKRSCHSQRCDRAMPRPLPTGRAGNRASGWR